MTKYLSMNGTSDYIKLPTLTLTKIVADVLVNRRTDYNRMLWDFRSGISLSYLQQTTSGIDQYQVGTVSVNGSTVTNSTAFIPNATRCTITHTFSSPGTDDGNIFSSYGPYANNYISGNIYDIKIYNGATLIAHYDMSTGTVNDQSGNGNNATLSGGTWLDSGGTTGTPVTYTYDTKQSIYANIQSNHDTKQFIYANRLTNFDTQQSIYQPINQPYDTKQAIYKAIQELFDTEQVFTQAYTQVSYTYDMKIQQYKDIQESLDTKQAFYTDISMDLDTKQVIYKQIQNLYDTLIQIRNKHDETLYGTLTIQRVIEHRLTINKRHSEDLKIERVLNHILRV